MRPMRLTALLLSLLLVALIVGIGIGGCETPGGSGSARSGPEPGGYASPGGLPTDPPTNVQGQPQSDADRFQRQAEQQRLEQERQRQLEQTIRQLQQQQPPSPIVVPCPPESVPHVHDAMGNCVMPR